VDYLSKYKKYKNKYSQIKYNLLIGGTNYLKQNKLEEEEEIPEIKYNGVDIRSYIFLKMYTPNNYSLFWTDDNEKSIRKYHNPYRAKCNYYPFKDISDEEYCKNNYLYYCILHRRGYQIIFNIKENLECFIKKNVEAIIKTPFFDETKPYSFIYYVKILNKEFNSFNVYFSYYLQSKICKSIMSWGNNLLKKYLTCNKKGVYLFAENPADQSNRLSQIKIHNNYVDSHVKLQMCIKDEYLFWVLENLCKNLYELKLCGLNSFKFYTPSNNKFKKIADFFPDHENNERIDSYYINCKEYKRELLASPTVVFYLSKYIEPSNINKLINKLKCLFPDNLDITNDFPRFNIRLTKNIFFSVGGDNHLKFKRQSLDFEIIPLEYKYILDKYDKIDINECKRLNEYSKNLTDHDILILSEGKYIPNNITSYYFLTNGSSFKDLFSTYGLEEFYVCPHVVNLS
jgi:hypothetical protein